MKLTANGHELTLRDVKRGKKRIKDEMLNQVQHDKTKGDK